jgi:2-keto-3-deoxy-L-rhamnonate aldolase RhmA
MTNKIETTTTTPSIDDELLVDVVSLNGNSSLCIDSYHHQHHRHQIIQLIQVHIHQHHPYVEELKMNIQILHKNLHQPNNILLNHLILI